MQVELWEACEGKSPVEDFIDELPDKDKSRVVKIIELFEEKGLNLIHTEYLKKLNLKFHDIYELRIKFRKTIYRVFVVIINEVAWLLHAFNKKSQKTPQREIDIAINRKVMLELELNNSININHKEKNELQGI